NAHYGFNFDPVTGGLRIVNDADQNIRVNPNTGLLTSLDTNLAFTAGDPNAGDNPQVVGLAYDQNFSGTPTTTVFGIEVGNNVLVRLGGVNGAPPPVNSSPNAGELTTIGALGVTTAGSIVGFDTEINPSNVSSR